MSSPEEPRSESEGASRRARGAAQRAGRSDLQRYRGVSSSGIDPEIGLTDSLERAHVLVSRSWSAFLRERGLSVSQFRLLECLRQVDAWGLACHELKRRIYPIDSDITRLVDRMERADLVHRYMGDDFDRRSRWVRLTPLGVYSIRRLEEPRTEWEGKRWSNFTQSEQRVLERLLRRVGTNG